MDVKNLPWVFFKHAFKIQKNKVILCALYINNYYTATKMAFSKK